MYDFFVEHYSFDESGVGQRFTGLLLHLHVIDVNLVSIGSLLGNLENRVHREFCHCLFVFGENLARQRDLSHFPKSRLVNWIDLDSNSIEHLECSVRSLPVSIDYYSWMDSLVDQSLRLLEQLPSHNN